MIDSLKGILIKKDPTFAVVDVNGVRFSVQITLSSYQSLPNVGQEMEIQTYLNFRQDGLDLFGFSGEEERNVFLLLTSVSGIGPKSAVKILSGTQPSEFRKRIVSGDAEALTVIPGIGAKTAQRIIVELKDKFSDIADSEYPPIVSSENAETVKDVITGLTALGYKRGQINQALRKLEEKDELNGSLEGLIKKALAHVIS